MRRHAPLAAPTIATPTHGAPGAGQPTWRIRRPTFPCLFSRSASRSASRSQSLLLLPRPFPPSPLQGLQPLEREELTVDTVPRPRPLRSRPQKSAKCKSHFLLCWATALHGLRAVCDGLRNGSRRLETGFSSPSGRIQQLGRAGTPHKRKRHAGKPRSTAAKQSKKSNLYLADCQTRRAGSRVHGRGGVFYRKRRIDRGHGRPPRKFLSTNYFSYFAGHRHSMACERYAAACPWHCGA